MPNLFPISNAASPSANETPARQVKFGRGWRFDFDAGEFVTTPTGKIAAAIGTDAWLQWCEKAIRTERYRHLIYSRGYGHEFDDLISRNLPREANESEIQRIVTETLKVDRRTADVRNFVFDWQDDVCVFTCEVTNIRGEAGTISGSVATSK